jgi:hypothetical protein
MRQENHRDSGLDSLRRLKALSGLSNSKLALLVVHSA